MVGSDLPTLPADHIRQAIDAVDPQTVVLGPTEDGGYYLMALATDIDSGLATVPDLFSGVRWSTSETLVDTRAAAENSGLRVAVVPAWYDVDDESGLARLRTELAAQPGDVSTSATAKSWGSWGDGGWSLNSGVVDQEPHDPLHLVPSDHRFVHRDLVCILKITPDR